MPEPPASRTYAPEAKTVALLAELCEVSSYFVVGTGPVDDGWQPVARLYTDAAMLGGIVGRVQERIDAVERRVAASTLFLGFAARLWSIGLGTVAGHGLLLDLAAEHLLFREAGGRIELHIEYPVAWQGNGLAPVLADTVLDSHLAPLTGALHRLGPISAELLRGNAASALLGAARVFDRRRADATPGPGWLLARQLCADERLAGAIHFNTDGYHRTSCCLYYRTAGGGLCGDCVLTHKPVAKHRKDAS
jgi:iron complex transport system ATP-binding protein